MQLGAFSLSLAVKDIAASAAFYEKLGFSKHGGDITQNWVILKNGEAVIGLFQGMFEKNAVTFNPGWNQDAQALDSFTDVRDLQRQLKARARNSFRRQTRKRRGRRALLCWIRTATRFS